MKLIPLILCISLLLGGCSAKTVMIYSQPAGVHVYAHNDYVRNLLGETPLATSMSDILRDWSGDGSDTSVTLIFKKSGYQVLRLKVHEFAMPSEINVKLDPL